MASTAKKKILWALDVFEPRHREIETHTLKALRMLVATQAFKVEPVYVLSPDQLDLSVEFTPPWLKKVKPAAEKALESRVAELKVDFPGLLPGTVLVQRQPSVSAGIKSLLAHAKATGADLIVVGSHGRAGLSRMMLGSFAESLILTSTVPVLVAGPETFSPVVGAPEQRLQRILYPTDFSAKSAKVFKRLCSFARANKAEVVLFHVITQPIEPVIQSGVYLMGGGWVSVPAFLGKEEERVKKIGSAWVAKAQATGVKVKLITTLEPGSVVDVILKHAEADKADFIAMAGQSGKIASVLIGSITRQVARAARCPVWVARA